MMKMKILMTLMIITTTKTTATTIVINKCTVKAVKCFLLPSIGAENDPTGNKL